MYDLKVPLYYNNNSMFSMIILLKHTIFIRKHTIITIIIVIPAGPLNLFGPLQLRRWLRVTPSQCTVPLKQKHIEPACAYIYIYFIYQKPNKK